MNSLKLLVAVLATIIAVLGVMTLVGFIYYAVILAVICLVAFVALRLLLAPSKPPTPLNQSDHAARELHRAEQTLEDYRKRLTR